MVALSSEFLYICKANPGFGRGPHKRLSSLTESLEKKEEEKGRTSNEKK